MEYCGVGLILLVEGVCSRCSSVVLWCSFEESLSVRCHRKWSLITHMRLHLRRIWHQPIISLYKIHDVVWLVWLGLREHWRQAGRRIGGNFKPSGTTNLQVDHFAVKWLKKMRARGWSARYCVGQWFAIRNKVLRRSFDVLFWNFADPANSTNWRNRRDEPTSLSQAGLNQGPYISLGLCRM
jgi:hypothetical protein